MYRFILFFRRISFILLFVAIEGLALHYFAGSSSYNQAKVISVSNVLVGDIYAGISHIKHVFSLGPENRRLNEEIAGLRERLRFYEQRLDTLPEYIPGSEEERRYLFSSARVKNNTINRNENYFTIDKGMLDGVETEMAVLANGAVAGYIVNCSDRFSVAISILNTNFRTSGRIQGQDYSGSVYWDGLRIDEVVLSEIPKYAPIAVGDTIVTSDYSFYFPPGLKIGTVKSYELINGTYYDARVTLFANMAALRYVVLADYVDRQEQAELEYETMNSQSY